MNIDYLRTFLTLAENGSFSETAKEHIVVQSTVSSRIQELEKELGRNIPTLKMITCSLKELDEKAGILLNKIQELNIDADIQKEKNVSQVGDRKSTRLNSSHSQQSRMPSSA